MADAAGIAVSRAGPVSYPHLDVYKRQALLLAIVALMLVSAYTILAFMRSDAALDRGDPAAALRARPDLSLIHI